MIEKSAVTQNWSLFCLANLFIASILGIIMRYKIIFPLPMVDQANVLHSHSHFVFQGWITLVLFCCFIAFILPKEMRYKKVYTVQFWLMQLSAFGMLITFFIYGYNAVSIAFSALSQFVFYWFAIVFIKDLRKSDVSYIVKGFAIAAVVAAVISSVGPYALGYFSSTGTGNPIVTRGAVYYYLHFQYNGWFSFAVFALFFQWLFTQGIQLNKKTINSVLLLFVLGLIPGYALSFMGFINNVWVHLLSWFAIITQLIGVFLLFKEIWKARTSILSPLPVIVKYLWVIALLSLMVKSILQALSLHPSLAIVAFSLRPLVIGYLHLIFICFVSFFLIGLLIHRFEYKYARVSVAKFGLITFMVASLLNEFLLFLQAGGYYFSFYIPTIPEILFGVTVVMSFSLLLFLLGQFGKKTSLISNSNI